MLHRVTLETVSDFLLVYSCAAPHGERKKSLICVSIQEIYSICEQRKITQIQCLAMLQLHV